MIELMNEYAQKFSKDLADTFKGEWIDEGQIFIGNANWEESPMSGTFKNVPCTLKLLNTGVYADSKGNVEVRVKYRITNNETDEVREDYCNLKVLLNKNYVF